MASDMGKLPSTIFDGDDRKRQANYTQTSTCAAFGRCEKETWHQRE